MGRKKNQTGKSVSEVGESSGKKQEEVMLAEEDLGDEDNSEKVDTNEGEDDSEWYVEWPQLEKPLISHLSFRSKEQLDSAGEQPQPERAAADVSILVPGCGRSKLSENLYDAGFKNITNLDLSKDVITEMLKENVRARPEMKWRVMDITNMQFANETFDAVVDKGGLDSLMEPTLGTSLGALYLYEVKRVLKAGGKYVCLTLAYGHILDLLFRAFRFGWDMNLYAIDQKASSRHPNLQIIMAVVEKMSYPMAYAVSLNVEQTFVETNCDQARVLCEALLVENKIRLEHANGKANMYSINDLYLGAVGDISKLVPGRRVNLSLGRATYLINNGVLLDAKEDSGPFIYPYAVFLVHQNRANDWLYTSEEGQWLLVENAKATRLLMFILDSIHSDLPIEFIQMDLSRFVEQLQPGYCGEGFEIPYLRAADSAKQREILYEDFSVLVGPIVVEDVIYDDDETKGYKFRRLIFKRTESFLQSEAILFLKESISTDVGKGKEQQVPNPKKKAKQRKSDSQSSSSPVASGEVKVVHTHIVSGYHIGIFFGIRLISSYLKVSTSANGLVNTVVIGLGGGLLPMYMRKYLPFLKIEVVELEGKILQIARKYFSFSEDESLKVHINDGVTFVKEKAAENSSCKPDILIVDVDTSDPSSALASPAADFIDESFLLIVKDLLSEQGLFIINMASGSSDARNDVLSKLKKVFSCILSLPVQEGNVNDKVLFAFKKIDTPIEEDQLSKACNQLTKSLELENKWTDEEVGVSKLFKLLN